MRPRLRVVSVLLLLTLFLSPLHARVLRVEIASRTDVLNGKSFGDAGSYERITGRVYFSLPVANPHNQRIVDLSNAVSLKNGEVEFVSDFVAVRPKDAHKGNGSMLLEVPNRGHARILSLVDGGDQDLSTDAGDAWLLRTGFTIVSLGWQWDAAGPDAQRLYAPVAKENGKTITGLLRGDLMPSKPVTEIPLGHLIMGNIGGTEYPVAVPDDPRNTLTVRDSRSAQRTLIPRTDWQFAHTVDGKLVPSDRHVHLNGGFQPGKIYEYVYIVADPVIAGGGFAVIRDFASYAKHVPAAVTPAVRVYGEGISQNGRFLRDFLYQGFNADEEGHMALDGILAHVAGAGRGSFNYRFAQPSRDAQPTSSVFFPTDIFPFTDRPETDPVTGETLGLLDRATADKVIPKIFFSNTSYEYFGRAAALIHVSADGKQDATIGDNVRIYHFTGLQHFSGPFPPEKGKGDLLGQQLQSPLPVKYFWRAMIANMDAWVRNNTLPPASSYPKIADGTLVPLPNYNPPAIPGVNRPNEANTAYRLDYGPNWQAGILSLQPPKVGPAFPVLVPQVDAGGNERDGVRLPEITVPLATYTGWNLRDPAIGAPDQRVSFEVSDIPFPKTAADRQKTGDPRQSIAERYASREDYMTGYTTAVDDLVKQRWILPEDHDALIHRGELEWAEAALPAHETTAKPDFGPNVTIFDPSMPSQAIQKQIDAVYATQEHNEFGPQRNALLFLPGNYTVDVPVGFYTEVIGLGASPDATRIAGNMHADANHEHNNATTTFWRTAEGISIAPAGGTMQWAVSQAVSLRRMHVRGDLVLHQHHGWASGGWMSDSLVDGNVDSGSQQQWISRNCHWKTWTGSNWNMVFVGVVHPPEGTWPEPPYTTVAQTPVVREKPFLQVNAAGEFSVRVPALRTDSVGITWRAAETPGETIPIAHFYIARPDLDTADTINAQLAQGKDLILTPGIYDLSAPIRVTRPHTVVLGLGFATLRPVKGTAAMTTADVDGIDIAGLLFDAGPSESPVLLEVGPERMPEGSSDVSQARHANDPITLHDVFFRVGGAAVGRAKVNLRINSNDTIVDHTWIWRADHGDGVAWDLNTSANGLVVNGNDVTIYGLFVEHHQQFQVLWNGNGGRTYFYQSEIPYDPPNQPSYTSAPGVNGWASYKVADTVTRHVAWGLGIYSVFIYPNVVLTRAIETPKTPQVRFHHMITVALGDHGAINHVINDTGEATAMHPRVTPKVADFP